MVKTIGDKPIPVSGDGDYILDTDALIPSLVEADMRRHGIPKGGKVCLETTPISKVPFCGVFICQAGQNVWHVYRKTNARARTYREYAVCEIVYSTNIGTRNKGKPNFFDDDDRVVYTGIVLKGEIA